MYRTIRESQAVEAELNRLRGQYPRFGDWWEFGWSWRLVRDPFRDAVPIPFTRPTVYLLKTSPHHIMWGFPFTLTLMYTVTDEIIDLIDIRFAAV